MDLTIGLFIILVVLQACHIYMLRNKLRRFAYEIYSWRYVCGPGPGEDVAKMMAEKGMTGNNLRGWLR
jgi:hypothetical protein